jgi:hypothetical protein
MENSSLGSNTTSPQGVAHVTFPHRADRARLHAVVRHPSPRRQRFVRRLRHRLGVRQRSAQHPQRGVSYCIDLYEHIAFGPTYTDYTLVSGASHAFANANAAFDIGKLYAEKNVVNTAKTQAAFQIAIWEIAYETSGIYDLGTGSSKFFGGSADTSGALALASTWLGALSTTTDPAFKISALDSIGRPGHQDQVFAKPVPEPTTYAMMAVGLLCMGAFARRRLVRQD